MILLLSNDSSNKLQSIFHIFTLINLIKNSLIKNRGGQNTDFSVIVLIFNGGQVVFGCLFKNLAIFLKIKSRILKSFMVTLRTQLSPFWEKCLTRTTRLYRRKQLARCLKITEKVSLNIANKSS